MQIRMQLPSSKTSKQAKSANWTKRCVQGWSWSLFRCPSSCCWPGAACPGPTSSHRNALQKKCFWHSRVRAGVQLPCVSSLLQSEPVPKLFCVFHDAASWKEPMHPEPSVKIWVTSCFHSHYSFSWAEKLQKWALLSASRSTHSLMGNIIGDNNFDLLIRTDFSGFFHCFFLGGSLMKNPCRDNLRLGK